MHLKDKVALITGASGGMGSMTAEAFARAGSTAIGIHYSHSEEKAREVLSEVEGLGTKGLLLKANVGNADEMQEAASQLHDQFGRIDAVVCFAGHPFRREEWFKKFEDLTPEEWKAPIDVDLLGSINSARAVVPYMKKQGAGSIVFISSTPALTGDTVGLTYMVAKTGILGLTRGLARALGPHNIRVNAIAPGSIRTPPMQALTEEEIKELVEETALKRLGEPEDIANAAVFLSSDDASYINGEILPVDGGYVMK